jgi:thermitase
VKAIGGTGWTAGSLEAWYLVRLQRSVDLTLGATSRTRIAFLDTGLDWNHPDLTPKGPMGYNFAENNGNWLDCNGYGIPDAYNVAI